MSGGEKHWWMQDWIVRERERRRNIEALRPAIHSFQRSMDTQIRDDLAKYFAEFPNERENIQLVEQNETGLTQIIRLRDEFSRYAGNPSAQFGIELNSLKFVCRFSPNSRRDREFPLHANSNGSVTAGNMSSEELSGFLLRPVLFDKLPEPTPDEEGGR